MKDGELDDICKQAALEASETVLSLTAEQKALSLKARAEKILVACDCDHLPHMREFVAAEMEAYASECVKQVIDGYNETEVVRNAVWKAMFQQMQVDIAYKNKCVAEAYEDAAKIVDDNAENFVDCAQLIRARAKGLK